MVLVNYFRVMLCVCARAKVMIWLVVMWMISAWKVNEAQLISDAGRASELVK